MKDVADQIKQAIHKPIYEELRELKKTTTHKDLGKMFDSNPTTIGLIINGDVAKVSLNALVDLGNKMGIEMAITTSADGVETETKLTK